MIKEKNKAHKKYLKNKTNLNRQYYIDIRNYVNEAISREKKAYMQFMLTKNKNNPKRLWNCFAQFGVCTKSNNSGKLPKEMCKPEEINHYFLNVTGQSSIDQDLLTYYKNNIFNDNIQFKFKEISNIDILKALKSIKSQAVGADNISIKMISTVMPYCLDFFRTLLNESINQGIFPEAWKISNIIPIPKIANPKSYNDLRPISLLPVFSKILEKIVAAQIKEYLETNSILHQHQSGFRHGHGTQTALLKVTNDLINSMDNSYTSFLILLDQSKAFDLVNFQLMLAKLKFLGFDNLVLNWFQSYLEGRSQRVIIEKTMYSSLRNTDSGVPQGSILGPLLFLIYTFDLTNCLSYCSVHMYADDIQMYYSFKSEDIIQSLNIVNDDLSNISNYSKSHGLRLNSSKTVAMCIGSERQRSTITGNYNISIDNNNIKWVEKAKNLGIIMDGSISFCYHVDHIFRCSMAKLKSMYKFKNTFSEKTKLQLTKSLIYPHIEYCCVVYYHFLPQYNRDRLQRIQNACVRFISKVPYREHITPHIIQLNELKVEDRINYLITIFLYKLLKSQNPLYLYSLLSRRSDIHDLNIRTNSFNIPQHSTKKFEGSFSFVASKFLNMSLNHLNLSEIQFISYLKSELFIH